MRLVPAPTGPGDYSSFSAASFKSSIIGRCWGQTPSHWPQAMQALALPEELVRPL